MSTPVNLPFFDINGDLASFLESTYGIIYIIDTNLILQYYQDNTFRTKDNAFDPKIGTNILDLMEGEEVKEYYQKIYHNLFTRKLPNFRAISHCDTPEMVRKDLIVMTPIDDENESVIGIIHQSIAIEEFSRPKISLLEPYELSESRPFIQICSRCARVNYQDHWISSQEYYRRGGKENVNLSHGFCDDCIDDTISEYEEFKESVRENK